VVAVVADLTLFHLAGLVVVVQEDCLHLETELTAT
jgi:hypothetical protein